MLLTLKPNAREAHLYEVDARYGDVSRWERCWSI